MLFRELKANTTYFLPEVSSLSITEVKVTSIDSYGYDYSYENYEKKIVKARAVKYEGRFLASDNITLFSDREDAKNYLKEVTERKIKEL